MLSVIRDITTLRNIFKVKTYTYRPRRQISRYFLVEVNKTKVEKKHLYVSIGRRDIGSCTNTTKYMTFIYGRGGKVGKELTKGQCGRGGLRYRIVTF